MFDYIELRDVGPITSERVELARRLNVFTGDNGLGKSFLLDVAWSILTRTWAGERVLGVKRNNSRPTINYRLSENQRDETIEFDFRTQKWSWERWPRFEYTEGLIIYAKVDGGFSVYDLQRNPNPDGDPFPPATEWANSHTIHFNSHTLWHGVPEENG